MSGKKIPIWTIDVFNATRDEGGYTYGEPYDIETYRNKKEASNKMANTYRFLDHVVDSEQLRSEGYSDLKDVGDDVDSAMINIRGDSSSGKLDTFFELTLDSRKMIKNYMDYDETLSKKVSDDFDSTYADGGWQEWRKRWVELQGWGMGSFGSDNTYNWGDFTGDVFEFTDFVTDDKRYGIIIMWHSGGDVRGNYSVPEIWIGDFESFISMHSISGIEEEMTYRLGYDGSWDNLERDIHNWWFETGGVSTIIQKDYEDAGQMRLPLESSSKGSKNVLEDWYLVGFRQDSGEDRLWNFEDPSGTFHISPPHIQGEVAFIEEMKGLYDGDYGETLAKEIIAALNESREGEMNGEEKKEILDAIDHYYGDMDIEINQLGMMDRLVVYQLEFFDKKAMNKESKSNEDVIRMFLEDSFPKDKRPVWGTDNLKISKRPNGWSLVNYSTPILYRADGESAVYFNTTKYSVTTSKIQSYIKRIANELGIQLDEMDESTIMSKGAMVNKVSGDIAYFSWIKKNYPEKYEYFQSIPAGQEGRYYEESQEFVRQKLSELTGTTINSSGSGYEFAYIEYYGSPRNKSFEKPDALIAYVNKIKNKSSSVKKADEEEEELDPIKRLEDDYSLDMKTATLIKEFLDDAKFDVDDVTAVNVDSGGWNGMIGIDIGTDEDYYLFANSDDAERVAKDMERQTLESEGLQTMLGDNWKQWLDVNSLRKDLYSDASNNVYESIHDGSYDSELESEWEDSAEKSELEDKIRDVEKRIGAEEDKVKEAELEEELDNLNSRLDDTKETFIDDLRQNPERWDKYESMIDSYLDEMMDNIGEYMSEKNLTPYFDYDKAAEDIVDSDGAGSILGSYDGDGHDLLSGGVWFRHN